MKMNIQNAAATVTFLTAIGGVAGFSWNYKSLSMENDTLRHQIALLENGCHSPDDRQRAKELETSFSGIKNEVKNSEQAQIKQKSQELKVEAQAFADPTKVVSSNGVSFRIERTEVSDYGKKVTMRLLVSNSGDVPVHVMLDGAEKFTATDLSGNHIELSSASGIYICHYGLRGKKFCSEYLSSAPVVDPGARLAVMLYGEANDRAESPITAERFDLNGKFLIFDPSQKLSIVTANFPGISISL